MGGRSARRGREAPSGKPNWANRSVFQGENLEFMRGMNAGTVHLVVTDPPFNKGRRIRGIRKRAAGDASFQDQWVWSGNKHPEWMEAIQAECPLVSDFIEWTRRARRDGMGAYLCFMGVRLLQMARVLRADGSIYVHSDPAASHYLKVLMDAIFGARQFRSHITWQRYGSHNDARKYAGVSDHILYYARPGATWNTQRTALGEEQVRKNYRYTDAKGRYTTSPLHARSLSGGGYEYEWKGIRDTWKFPKARLEEMDTRGDIHWPEKGKVPRRKVYLTEDSGKPLGDVFGDIAIAGERERTGYPTQKPLELYRRLIRASSNAGEVVFDPFAGSGTTLVAAEIEGREWVGGDLWEGTEALVRERMKGVRKRS